MLRNTLRFSTAMLSVAAASCIFCTGTAEACNYATRLAQMGMVNSLNVAPHGSAAQDSAIASQETSPTNWSGREDLGIVGFWNELTYYQGSLIDQRYDNWFADHNEAWVDLSPPATNDVCNGVWKQVGPRTYKLLHAGFNFDATTGDLLNKVVFHVVVVLSEDGNSFTATETDYAYDPTGTVLLATYTGITTTATRFKVDF